MSKHLSPAYQLYSAREDASNDLEGVLDQLSRMGYEGVEFAGFFEKTAKEVRKLLKHTGLKAVSSHVPLQQIRDDMQSGITTRSWSAVALPCPIWPRRTARVSPALPACWKRCIPSAGSAKNAASCCSITTTTLNLLRSAA